MTEINSRTSEEQKKREKWRKECLQNEQVKKMFQMQDKDKRLEDISKVEDASKEELDMLKDSTTGLLLTEDLSSPSKSSVKGGDLARIVMWATSHEFYDQEFITALLMTHHSFTTSLELLDQFIKRYQITPPYGLTQRVFEIYIKRKIVPIRMNVCTILLQWVENFFEGDFAQNESLVLYFRDFVETKITPDFKEMGKKLMNILQEKINAPVVTKMKITPAASPSTKSDFLLIATDASVRHHLEIDAVTFYEYTESSEMAKHLTLIGISAFNLDFNHFSRVKPHELLDQIWGERRLKELTAGKSLAGNEITGISRMINHTNHLIVWVATKIVNNPALKGRVNALKYFAQTALYCREYKNFNGVTGIVAGLSVAPVLRLKKTWAAFAEKFPKTSQAYIFTLILSRYAEVAELVSPKGQYGNYRKVLKELSPPAIPFLGVYLTDLTFIELGNPGFIPDSHLINFDKRRKAYQLIKEIQYFQTIPYQFLAIPALIEVLQQLGTTESGPMALFNQTLIPEDQLYDISLVVEPRDEEEDDDDT